MNAFRILALLVLASCGAAWAPAAETGRPASPLRAKLAARASYVLGNAVQVELTLENVSSEPVAFLAWNTPFDRLGGDAFRVRRDGAAVRFRGALAKRGEPRIEDYVRIEPGGAATATADLAASYDLSPAGSYAVEFAGRLLDVVVGAERLPHRRDEMHGATVPAGPVVLRLVEP